MNRSTLWAVYDNVGLVGGLYVNVGGLCASLVMEWNDQIGALHDGSPESFKSSMESIMKARAMTMTQ